MARQARIDTSGALHHVICRGIDRQEIFQGKDDYSFFLKRLGDLLMETKTSCFAWALSPNHFYLLLRTGNVPISVLIKKYRLKAKGYDLDKLITRISEITQVTADAILDSLRDAKRTAARSILCYWATEKLGTSQSQLAQMLRRSQSSITYAVRRGKAIVEKNSYTIG